ncbi:GntR family transcriptional regulator [Phenylobacterium sp. Root77]|uniref:aminotransferase-like domain-containing protein n=1 Tax=unclassified Phenylobacterium TaxID=2640670 RepID=UPI0007022DAA|nr:MULTISPECIES: PLP-dependent aminotransferase family protein [unclassified Phenylobacterium]KQW72837.1 GntR family transcriptional regulator [Phenylobacterium sp. Root1277]KQW92054.1 GntR family transcriptional regulator [Phenylobacterium sp. Root1290]KRC40286.1 GntR family transcriptional regulator [Phenylobacterium sp. Root77]
MASPATLWLRRVERGDGPIYLAILRGLEAAIADGELQAGEQLPPQRAVASALGVDFTTVTRAYTAARARGLVEGSVGRGTFVAGRAAEDEAGLVDLSMNLPPPPKGLNLGKLLKETAQAVLERTDAQALMAYHPSGGSLAQRTAGATWLAPCLGQVAPDRIVVAPGAQAALTAALALLARRGDAVIVEPLTYPGLRSAAALLGLRLVPCPVDEDGFDPQALARLCAETAPRAIYCIPTQQNPTAATMSESRRRAIAALARTSGVPIIEDDAYGRLPADPVPAIAAFAPEMVWHLATTAKALSPGLRIGFVAAPDASAAQRLAEALRATTLMPAPLSAAIVTAWIREGTAERVLAAVRAEASERQALARQILPAAKGSPEGIHIWLDTPDHWPGERLRETAQSRGLSLVTADAFAAAPGARAGLRISLGGPSKQTVLAQALRGVAAILDGEPTGRMVV